MMDLVKAKMEQAIDILKELNIDLWMIFCRESDMMADPSLALVVGHKVVWQSAFFFFRSGQTLALVGNYDASDFERARRFRTVVPYVEDCGPKIRQIIEENAPQSIALNYSPSDDAADGLTHGMFLLLNEYLEGSEYRTRFISSEKIISLLRGRKTREEVELISSAAFMAADCWNKALKSIRAGMTEIEIGQLIDHSIKLLGGENSFDTIVNAGAKSSPGHGHPTKAVLEPGDLLHVDFGVRLQNYCSDIQRLVYVRRKNESAPPPELLAAFDKVREVIDETAKLYRPGAVGHEIDAVARQILTRAGYPEYQHALGHQIGRSVHDGSALVGPFWKRYGVAPKIPLEKGNVFTVELGIELPGIGYVGLEEDLEVTEKGGRFLCPRQTELAVI